MQKNGDEAASETQGEEYPVVQGFKMNITK